MGNLRKRALGMARKMKYREILNLSEVLEEGFFADKVVDLVKERKALGPNDEKILREVLDFVKKAKRGERQVSSGRLSTDALDSIGAYHRAMSIIATRSISESSEKEEKKVFNEILKAIESEVKAAIERRIADPHDLKQTFTFFDSVRSQTLSEGSAYYSKKVEVVSWPSLLY